VYKTFLEQLRFCFTAISSVFRAITKDSRDVSNRIVVGARKHTASSFFGNHENTSGCLRALCIFRKSLGILLEANLVWRWSCQAQGLLHAFLSWLKH